MRVDLELREKVVFVARASRGIGFGIAEAFLEEGAKVAITGRNLATLAESEAKLHDAFPSARLSAIAGDMTLTADEPSGPVATSWPFRRSPASMRWVRCSRMQPARPRSTTS